MLVAIFALRDGCKTPPTVDNRKVIDSFRSVIKSDSLNYVKVHQLDSIHIATTSAHADTLEAGYKYYRDQAVDKGRKLLDLNGRYQQARAQLDTILALSRCDSLSLALDSTAQLVWNAGRKVDSLLFVNDDLKNAQDTALAHCRITLGINSDNFSKSLMVYEAQLVSDQAALKKAKKGKVWGWVSAGVMTVLAAIKK